MTEGNPRLLKGNPFGIPEVFLRIRKQKVEETPEMTQLDKTLSSDGVGSQMVEKANWKLPLNKWGWAAALLFCLVFLGAILGLPFDRETAFHHSQEIEILTNVLLVVLASLCILSLAKCRKIPEAIIPGVILFLVFQGLFLTKEHGDTYRACCARVQADMKYLVTQIETYRIDYKYYPGSLQNLNFGIKQAGVSQGAVSSGHSGETQPNRAILDFFAKPDEPDRAFGYWMKPDEGTDKTGGYFIWSRGPNTRSEFEPERLCQLLENEGVQSARDYFCRNTYDPTNGFQSSGDLIRCGGVFSGKGVSFW